MKSLPTIGFPNWGLIKHFFLKPYGWLKKSCTMWDVSNLVNTGIIYHIDWCRISSINSIIKPLFLIFICFSTFPSESSRPCSQLSLLGILRWYDPLEVNIWSVRLFAKPGPFFKVYLYHAYSIVINYLSKKCLVVKVGPYFWVRSILYRFPPIEPLQPE